MVRAGHIFCLLYSIDKISCVVPTDPEGIIPSALEETVTSHNAKPATRPLTETKPYRGMMYLIPTFHNPTGKCLSPGKHYCDVHVESILTSTFVKTSYSVKIY